MKESEISLALKARNWKQIQELLNAGAALTYTRQCALHNATIPYTSLEAACPNIIPDIESNGPTEIEESEIKKFAEIEFPSIKDIRELKLKLNQTTPINNLYKSLLNTEAEYLEQEINSSENKHLALLASYILTPLSFTGIAGWSAPLIMSFSAIMLTATLYNNRNLTEFYDDLCISIHEKVFAPINSWQTSARYTLSHMHRE